MRFIFLAAGVGKRIYKKIGKNKCLIEVDNKPLIIKLIQEVENAGINKISVVVGFRSLQLKKEIKKFKKVKFIYNKKFRSQEMLYSLILALKRYDSDVIISYSDILFNKEIIKKVIKNKKNITIPILKNWKKIWRIRNKNPFIDGETLEIDRKKNLQGIGEKIKILEKTKYQYMGIIFIPKNMRKKFINEYSYLTKNKKLHVTQFLNLLIKKNIIINTNLIKKGWYEFDDYEDYKNYKKNIFN